MKLFPHILSGICQSFILLAVIPLKGHPQGCNDHYIIFTENEFGEDFMYPSTDSLHMVLVLSLSTRSDEHFLNWCESSDQIIDQWGEKMKLSCVSIRLDGDRRSDAQLVKRALRKAPHLDRRIAGMVCPKGSAARKSLVSELGLSDQGRPHIIVYSSTGEIVFHSSTLDVEWEMKELNETLRALR